MREGILFDGIGTACLRLRDFTYGCAITPDFKNTITTGGFNQERLFKLREKAI
jgi:hypothetical protein